MSSRGDNTLELTTLASSRPRSASHNTEYSLDSVPKPITTNNDEALLSTQREEDEVETGEQEQEDEDTLTLAKAAKRYPKLVGYCLALTIAIIGWGYDLVVVGGINSVESFQTDYGQLYEGEMIIPAHWLSLWMALGRVGTVAGSVAGGWMQDGFGRKYSIMAGSIISATSVTIIFFSCLPADIEGRRGVFLAGKIIQGFSVGVIKTTAMTYVSENAPTSLRGSAMALFPTFTLVGQLLGSLVLFGVNGVPGKVGYLAAIGSQWILALLPFMLSCVMPDSPSYLLRKGRESDALRAAQRLFEPRVSASNIIEKTKLAIQQEESTNKESEAKATYMDCFRGTHGRRTWIVILANLFPAAFGLDHLSNSSYFLQTLGLDSGLSLIFLILGIAVGMLANGASIFLLPKVGRRAATLVSMGAAGVLWCAMGVAGAWGGINKAVAYATSAFLLLIIAVCGVGCWPAGYAIMGETSSLRLRAKTQAVGGVAQQSSSVVLSVVLPYIFNPDSGHAGAKTGFLFAGLCAMAEVACWFSIPEMKGRSITDIDHMFDIRLPTRKFKTWHREGGEYM